MRKIGLMIMLLICLFVSSSFALDLEWEMHDAMRRTEEGYHFKPLHPGAFEDTVRFQRGERDFKFNANGNLMNEMRYNSCISKCTRGSVRDSVDCMNMCNKVYGY